MNCIFYFNIDQVVHACKIIAYVIYIMKLHYQVFVAFCIGATFSEYFVDAGCQEADLCCNERSEMCQTDDENGRCYCDNQCRADLSCCSDYLNFCIDSSGIKETKE